MTWGQEYICTNLIVCDRLHSLVFHNVWHGHVHYPMRSNIQRQDFLTCEVEFSTPMAHLFCIRLGLLLSKKRCAVAESEVNAGWKLDKSENLRDFDHHDTVETWKPGAVMIGLFTPIQTAITVEGQIEEWRGVAFLSNFYWLVLKRHAASS